jgi:sugar/nucleoside kinase (ribokinase family)
VQAVVAGAISQDIDASGARAPGGVVQHAGVALATLGARVHVLTRCACRDAPELLRPLREAGVVVHHCPGRTTVCENDYRSGAGDHHHLHAVSETLRAVDVPAVCLAPDVLQLGPLHPDDLEPGLARRIRATWTGLDVQGLLRRRSGATTRLAAPRALRAHLAGVDVVKASASELPYLLAGSSPCEWLQRLGVRELLVTRGAAGATLFGEGPPLRVAALPVPARHLAGAGDVFLAAYLLSRVRALDPASALRVASRVSAAKIVHGALPRGAHLLARDHV